MSEPTSAAERRDPPDYSQSDADGNIVWQGYAPDDDLTVLGYCPHGVNLDREFCPEGCRV